MYITIYMELLNIRSQGFHKNTTSEINNDMNVM